MTSQVFFSTISLAEYRITQQYVHAVLVGRTVFRELCGLASFGAYSGFGAITPTKPTSISIMQHKYEEYLCLKILSKKWNE